MIPLERHCQQVVRAVARGDVVPLLGAGANLCDRPSKRPWEPGRFLPSGAELAEHLADCFDYPLDDRTDLVRVSQYVDIAVGEGPLYTRLHEVFAPQVRPNSLHRFLAGLPASLSTRDHPARHLLVITTNYDDMLERAFGDAGEPFDLLVYMATGRHRGRFLHVPPGGEPRSIGRPNDYRHISLDRRSVILKLHGAVDRVDESRDSFVVTEDHYIDYLTHTNPSQLVPAPVLAKLMRSHFLFLGYRLRDWNLRVILHRIWRERHHGYRSWAIQREADPIEVELWSRREVDVYDVPLRRYVAELERRIERDGAVAVPARSQ